MLLKIDIKPENILKNENGELIVKISRYTQVWLCSVEGQTLEDFNKNPAKKSKYLDVGSNGGISLR